jgi:F-type H+-transporting ATPase subunit b
MHELMQDPMFWYAVPFAIFCVLAWRYARKPILAWLDAEILKIDNEIKRAKQLRAEAETTLASCRKNYANAMAEADEIVRYAQEEAADLKKQAERALKAALERQEQQAAERIRLTEGEAVAAVQAAAVEEAMHIVRKTLDAQMDKAGSLVDQAIAELPKLAASKAKAA